MHSISFSSSLPFGPNSHGIHSIDEVGNPEAAREREKDPNLEHLINLDQKRHLDSDLDTNDD